MLSRSFRFLRVYPFSLLNNHVVDYPTPVNFTYFWGFGSLAGLLLLCQIITGVFLSFRYTPHAAYAFDSVEYIMRDVLYGWLLRYGHAVGASMFFIVVYVHMARGLYSSSFISPRDRVWSIGVLIFFLMIATAFMGYVLPWGQMSFRGATVITNLFTALPLIGESIAYWLWGGFSVDNATLNRFFGLHYLLPFLIVGLVIIHIAFLHFVGSGNPVGFTSVYNLPFYPYFYVKDLYGFLAFSVFFSAFVFFSPNYLGHPDNYIEANALVTPTHIVPEWYFLPFYAILRSIPNKFFGVVAMVFSILVLLLMPLIIGKNVRGGCFMVYLRFLLWFIILNFIVLGWLGACPVEVPFIQVSQCSTIVYFITLFWFMPFFSFINFESVFRDFRVSY